MNKNAHFIKYESYALSALVVVNMAYCVFGCMCMHMYDERMSVCVLEIVNGSDDDDCACKRNRCKPFIFCSFSLHTSSVPARVCVCMFLNGFFQFAGYYYYCSCSFCVYLCSFSSISCAWICMCIFRYIASHAACIHV